MTNLSKLILAGACFLPCTSMLAQAPTAGEEIDLGLSVNWRAYNIGASLPEEKGTIYAYASTKAGGYSMQNKYPFFNQMTWEINLPEGNLAGNDQYDAAALETEGRWRMATKEQWEELINGCDITAYEYNGVTGALLTSKANGNSIFLPSTELDYSTSCSYYASESNGSAPYVAKMAANQYQTSKVALMATSSTVGPWCGLPLRPICDRYEGNPLEAINLTATSTRIFAGTSTQLTATSVPADVPMSLKYESSNEDIATVSEKGLVSAHYGTNGGIVTITATSGNISSSIDITVTAVETDPTDEVVDLGLSVDWCAADLGAADNTVNGASYPFCYLSAVSLENAFSYKYYKSSAYSFPEENFCGNESYDAVTYNAATLAYAGERLPSKAEFDELIANCEPHYSFTGDEAAPDRREIILVSKVNGKAIRFPMSSAMQIYYSGSTNTEKNAAYALYLYANPTSASIETAPSPWMSYPLRGVVDHSTVPDLAEIELNLSEATIFEENTVRLTASPLPMGSKLENLVWTSDNNEIATVSTNGVVLGVHEGTTIITASSGAVSASATITVQAVNLTQSETVDMGTDVMWYNRELNAPSQAESGSLYYFGNLTPATSISSNQAAWVDPGIDVIGGTQFDPARVELGADWRMPTMSELLALGSKCEIAWITYGGRRGALLTSKDTGNRMFCPLPTNASYVFYMSDKLQRNATEDGSPIVEGLYITPTQASMNSVRAWRPCPIRPVNINHGGTSGIDSVASEAADDEITAIYTLDGRSIHKTATLSPGVYILLHANGKTTKQLVK